MLKTVAQNGSKRLNSHIFCCLTATIFVYGMMAFSILDTWSNGPVVKQTTMRPVAEPDPESRHVKSNMFMLKDAFCNFNNGDLVCYRAVGKRRATEISGS